MCVLQALDPQPGDSVLDLCCAPGAKLCMIAEMMGREGTLVSGCYLRDDSTVPEYIFSIIMLIEHLVSPTESLNHLESWYGRG